MSQHLYFVRHGQTEWNTERRMQGQNDSPLTAEGIAGAKRLAGHVKTLKFSQIYCSPSGRTRHTAQLLLEGIEHVPIQFNDNLLEISLASWEGKVKDEIHDHELFDAFWHRPHQFLPTEGESFYAVQQRITGFVNQLVSHLPENENALIVTHTTVIKTFIWHALQRQMETLWAEPVIYPATLVDMEFDHNSWKLNNLVYSVDNKANSQIKY
jgi:probable phosphoglycerate mutase